MERYKDIEVRIRKIGRRLYTSSITSIPSLFDKRRWKGKMMEWAMEDEDFKVRLFRFIDVLPSLKTNSLVVRLLKEYFSDLTDPSLLIRGIKGLPERGPISTLTGRLVRLNVESIARQFIAGSDHKDAISSIKGLREAGFASSIDLLGEVVLSEVEADGFKNRYMDIIESLYPVVKGWKHHPVLDRNDREELPRLDISLKVSSFYSQIDPIDWDGSIAHVKERLIPIFDRAKERGFSITFDMEHYYLKDITIEIFKTILDDDRFKDLPFAGIAIQAYLKDSKDDLKGLIEWARQKGRRITIRLVKGAYWDYETVINRQKGWDTPVFINKDETDLNYEELTRILLENSSVIRPAIASHNIRSISHAIAVAEALELPKKSIEFQMLYGMAEPLSKSLRDMGYRVRIYTPVGELIPGMAYLVRRLLENTSNESFLRRSFVAKTPFEELIRTPLPPKEVSIEKDGEGHFRNEPLTDFSKRENREGFKRALMEVREGLNRRYPIYIGGEEIFTEREIVSTNPVRADEVIGRVSASDRKTIDRAIEEAEKAFSLWRKTRPEERAWLLFKAAEKMRERRFELSAIEVYEVGKDWKEADADVAEAIDYLEYYGREMIRLGRGYRLGNYPGELNEYVYEPRGIGVVISPWNFPIAIPTGMISAAIVTGNCVIFKPSSLSPVTGWWLVEVFKEAGIPPGVLQYLPGEGGEIGDYLIEHNRIDFIAFTGSKEIGLRIIEQAGKTSEGQRNIKRVIAEMGGKNAIIIDETADLDEAVRGVVESATGYQGQKCSACSRVIIVGDIFHPFCKRLEEAIKSLNTGSPESPENRLGPVIDRNAVRRIKRYIEIGKKEAGVVILTGKHRGNFIAPVLFMDVKPDARIAQEEIFGPVIAIMRANDIDEAIGIANSTAYGLTGGIYSRSPVNIKKVKEGMQVGNLYINRKITGAMVGRQPFGGFGMSGIGSKAGGPDYLLQFLQPKSISENTMRRGFAPQGYE